MLLTGDISDITSRTAIITLSKSVSITSTKIAMNMLRTILNRLLLKNSGTDVRISLKKSVILDISMISCGFNLHKYHLKSLARQLAA